MRLFQGTLPRFVESKLPEVSSTGSHLDLLILCGEIYSIPQLRALAVATLTTASMHDDRSEKRLSAYLRNLACASDSTLQASTCFCHMRIAQREVR